MKHLTRLSILVLILLSISTVCYAEGSIDTPVEPNVENISIEEANKLIEDYNAQVDDYNEQITALYEEKCLAVDQHNSEEDQKVEENQAALEAQAKVEANIERDAARGITDPRTDNPEDIPTTWEDTTDTPKSIIIEKSDNPTEKTYQVANIHLFLDDDYATETSTYHGLQYNSVEKTFSIDSTLLSHMVVGEWETVTVNENDYVIVISDAQPMGYKSAAFYKNMEGYTQGYWVPAVHEFGSVANTTDDLWISGSAIGFTMANGTIYNQTNWDLVSLFTYMFQRTGAEPEHVDKYEPNYLDMPSEPTLLNHMDYLEETKPIIEPIIEPVVEPTIEPVVKPVVEPINSIVIPTKEITEEAVPLAKSFTTEPQTIPSIVIKNNKTPLVSNIEQKESWALINLILMICSALALLKLNKKHYNIFSIILTVGAILFFIFTENVHNQMVIIDEWTWISAVIYVLMVVSRFFGRKEKEEEEEENI